MKAGAKSISGARDVNSVKLMQKVKDVKAGAKGERTHGVQKLMQWVEGWCKE